MTYLLINPWIYDFAAYNLGVKPVGLLRVASFLRNSGDVQLVDCLSGCVRSKEESGFSKFRKEKIEKPYILKNINRPYFRYGIPIDEFREKLAKIKTPDAIFVTSAMTYWYPGVILAIEILKKFFPKAPITLGGIYATLCFEHASIHSGANQVWQGAYVKGDLEKYPPAHDLLEDKEILPIRASEGCPFSCSYCASKILTPVFNQRDPVKVFETLMYCKKTFGTTTFVFYDDALFFKADSGIKKLLRMVKASDLNFNFYTPNGLHAKFIDAELAYLMKETGFRDLRLSLETSDADIQEFTGGKVINKDIKRAIALLKESGFEKKDIGIYIVAGAPYLNLEKTKKDILFVNSLGAKAILASYSPIPGTKDYRALVAKGIIEDDIDPLWHNNTIFFEKITPGAIDKIKYLRRFASTVNM